MVRLVAVIALASCGHPAPPPPASAAAASAPAEPPPPAVEMSASHAIEACTTVVPFTVTTQNLTLAHGDLCAAFNRVVHHVPASGAFAGAAVQVTLTDLVSRPDTTCQISITISQSGSVVSEMRGGARVAGGGTDAARDCIESVLEDLMVRRAAQMTQGQTTSTAPAPVPPTTP